MLELILLYSVSFETFIVGYESFLFELFRPTSRIFYESSGGREPDNSISTNIVLGDFSLSGWHAVKVGPGTLGPKVGP